MKIELTTEEVAMILMDFLSKHQGVYEKGAFDIQWQIAAASGQPSIFIGAHVTISAPPKTAEEK